MQRSLEHFLRHRSVIRPQGSYGRAFGVTVETWRLNDDPQKVKPRTERLVTGRTAADAADFARMAASLHPEHGFHKPSGAWWASDGECFHRYRVHGGRPHGAVAVILATGVAGLAAAYLHRRRSEART
jgi:hypothetical protein